MHLNYYCGEPQQQATGLNFPQEVSKPILTEKTKQAGTTIEIFVSFHDLLADCYHRVLIVLTGIVGYIQGHEILVLVTAVYLLRDTHLIFNISHLNRSTYTQQWWWFNVNL